LSLDGLHLRETDVAVTDEAVKPVGEDGGEVSAHTAVFTVTLATAERFPAASYASTPSTYAVPQTSPANVKLVPDPLETNEPPR
jgi:hypothetical protein